MLNLIFDNGNTIINDYWHLIYDYPCFMSNNHIYGIYDGVNYWLFIHQVDSNLINYLHHNQHKIGVIYIYNSDCLNTSFVRFISNLLLKLQLPHDLYIFPKII